VWKFRVSVVSLFELSRHDVSRNYNLHVSAGEASLEVRLKGVEYVNGAARLAKECNHRRLNLFEV